MRVGRGEARRGNEASSKAGVQGGKPQAACVGGAEEIEVDAQTVMAKITVQGEKVSLSLFARWTPRIRAGKLRVSAIVHVLRRRNDLHFSARAFFCADRQCLSLHQVRHLKKAAATDETLQRSLVLEIEELKRLKALLPSTGAELHVRNRKRRKQHGTDSDTIA